MIWMTPGPMLRNVVASRCFNPSEPGFVRYKYTDDAGKVTAEYAATRIRITAAYLKMDADLLAGLHAAIRGIPGHLESTRITGHPTLRPQVRATFDRTVAP